MEQPIPTAAPAGPSPWPALPFTEWKDTCATLHMWTQIVGKVRMVHTPPVNHSWHVPLYLSARGMTTSPIPYGPRVFEIEFDFIDHVLRIQASDGAIRTIDLRPRSVKDFYRELMARLSELGFLVRIHATPNEVAEAIPFDQDEVHAQYDPQAAHRCWRVLLQADRVMKRFRSSFIGKCSPVHFFWGSFDLAVTRFSGRTAPSHPGGIPNCPDWVTREAYSHEVSSCGFWPGSEAMPDPIFYSYAYPEPPGFGAATPGPADAAYLAQFGEFILPYDSVRTALNPDATLLDFFQGTYEAAADLGKWDRAALERSGAADSSMALLRSGALHS